MSVAVSNCYICHVIRKWGVKTTCVGSQVKNCGAKLQILQELKYGFVITECSHLHKFCTIQGPFNKH